MDIFLVSVHSSPFFTSRRYFELFDIDTEINLDATTYEDAVCEADMLLFEEVPT